MQNSPGYSVGELGSILVKRTLNYFLFRLSLYDSFNQIGGIQYKMLSLIRGGKNSHRERLVMVF